MKYALLLIMIFLYVSCSSDHPLWRSPASENNPEGHSYIIDQEKAVAKDFCNLKEARHKTRYLYSSSWNHELYFDPENKLIDVVVTNEDGQDYVHEFSLSAVQKERPYKLIYEGEISEDQDDTYPTRDWYFEMKLHSHEVPLQIVEKPIRQQMPRKDDEVYEQFPSGDFQSRFIYLFPRKVTPSITLKEKGETKFLEVTLPTEEKVFYDAKSRKVLGGAFVETRRDDNGISGVRYSPSNKHYYNLIFPDTDVSYQGKGVWIEVPLTYNKDYRKKGNILVIHKGNADCKVPSEELFINFWGQDDPNDLNSGWSCTRFKYPSDAEFNEKILKKYCDFQLDL